MPDLTFSLIVPTRQRVAKLRRFLNSLAATTARPEQLEVVLVIDADDEESQAFRHHRLAVKKAIVPPGQPMGTLNQMGFKAAAGQYLMLLNDDVIVRTRRWDKKVSKWLRRFPDEIVLVHVNDMLFGQGMCTFPLVSRTYCELAGGICPPEYQRYRIDDHIEQVFNLLGILGENRILYLPEVVFEHEKYLEPMPGVRRYYLDEEIEAVDAPRFTALFPQRKELALALRRHVAGGMAAEWWRRRLDEIDNAPDLRAIGRRRLESVWRRWLRFVRKAMTWVTRLTRSQRRRGAAGSLSPPAPG